MGQCQGMYQTPVGPGGIPLVTSFAVEKQSPWALPCYGKKKYIVRDNYDNSVKNLEPLLDEIDDILSVNLEYDFDNVKPRLLAEYSNNSFDISLHTNSWHHWNSSIETLQSGQLDMGSLESSSHLHHFACLLLLQPQEKYQVMEDIE